MPKTKTCWCSLLACYLEIECFLGSPMSVTLGRPTWNRNKKPLEKVIAWIALGDTNRHQFFVHVFLTAKNDPVFVAWKLSKATNISTICFNFQIHLLKCHLWCPTSNIHPFTSLRPQTSQHAYCVLPYGSGIHAHDTTNIKEERTHLVNLFFSRNQQTSALQNRRRYCCPGPPDVFLAQKTNLVTVELQLHRHPQDLEEKNPVPSKNLRKKGCFLQLCFCKIPKEPRKNMLQ